MIVNIIQNLGVLTLLSFGFVYLQIHAERLPSIEIRQFLLGIMFSLVITVVMLDPVRISEGATIDLRSGPAILAGIFGGPIGATIAAVIGSLVRWFVVGGPVALGGVIGFVLYGVFGAIAGSVISRFEIKISPPILISLGLLGAVAVLPSFFVSVDFPTGLKILEKVGPLFLANNVLSTLIVGLFLVRARDWVTMRERLVAEQNENLRLALIARETNTGVIITNNLGLTEWINNAFSELSGFSGSEIIGKKPGALLQGKDTDPETIQKMSSAIRDGEAFDVEVLNYHKSGSPYWVQIYCEPFVDPDGTTKFMAIETNISERKEVEKLKSQFVSLVNHELRTPLTSIIGSIGLLRSGMFGDFSPKASELIEITKSNSERLLELINDILDFEKLQSGGMEFQFEDVDLDELANSVIKLNAAYAEQYNITIVRGDALKDVWVNGDKNRLSQVLTNLLSNASKFGPSGSEVSLTLSMRGSNLRLEVADLGPGVPDEFHDKVFERFTQAQSGDNRAKGGTGLGLSISKGIIEAHNGEIGFLSNEPSGAIFYIELPSNK